MPKFLLVMFVVNSRNTRGMDVIIVVVFLKLVENLDRGTTTNRKKFFL